MDGSVTDEQRFGPRTRLFVAASLRVGARQCPVTIRNLSATGARVELTQPPPVGTEVELWRATTTAPGSIVWAEAGACGIQFKEPIQLERWIPSSGQQRVDEALDSLRSGREPERPEMPAGRLPDDQLMARVAAEVDYVARMLETLGDGLGDDPLIAARHGLKLQDLDIAKQILGHLSVILVSPDREGAIARIGMAELRRRLSPTRL